MSRYSPTLQTPLPPALKEQEPSQAGPGAVAAGSAVAAAAAAAAAAGAARAASVPPETALSGVPALIGYEPTTLEPVVRASARRGLGLRHAGRAQPRSRASRDVPGSRVGSVQRRRARPSPAAPAACRRCRQAGRRRRCAGGAGRSPRPPRRSSSRWWRSCSCRTRTVRLRPTRRRRSPGTRRSRRDPDGDRQFLEGAREEADGHAGIPVGRERPGHAALRQRPAARPLPDLDAHRVRPRRRRATASPTSSPTSSPTTAPTTTAPTQTPTTNPTTAAPATARGRPSTARAPRRRAAATLASASTGRA